MAHKHPRPAPAAEPPAPATADADPSALDSCQLFPGGESFPAYRLAFNMFVVLFLLQVCVGLLGYLGWYLKAWTQ